MSRRLMAVHAVVIRRSLIRPLERPGATERATNSSIRLERDLALLESGMWIFAMTALVTPPMAHAGNPEKVRCKEDLAAIDELYIDGERDAAWALAEEVAIRCGQEGLIRRPRYANELWDEYHDSWDAGRLQESLAPAERELLLNLAAKPGGWDTAFGFGELGKLHVEMGDYGAALSFHQRSLAIREQLVGPSHPRIVSALNNLAAAHESLSDFQAALLLYQRALAIRERTLRSKHKYTAVSLNNVARMHRVTGDYGAALLLFQRALAIREKVYGLEDPWTVSSLNNLGEVHLEMGAYAAALAVYSRSLAARQNNLGPDDIRTATSLNNVGRAHLGLGNYRAALPLLERALTVYETVHGKEHPATTIPLGNLAMLYHEIGNFSAAMPLLERSLAINETVLGPHHPDTAGSLNNLARLLDVLGDHGTALPLYRRSHAILETVLGPEHPTTAGSLNNLALLHHSMGDYGAALPLYERSLAIKEAALGLEHPSSAGVLNNLAWLHVDMGDHGAALPLFKSSLATLERTSGAEHPNTATSLSNLAIVHANIGDLSAALPLYKRSLAINQVALGPEHRGTAVSLGNLGSAYESMGDLAAALPLFKRSLAVFETTLGPEHAYTMVSLGNLARLYRSLGQAETAQPLVNRAITVALGSRSTSMRSSVFGGAARQAAAKGNLTEAVLWGKLSVEALEKTRGGLEQADRDLAQSFTESSEHTYRHLVDNLVSLGRIAEAEGVLALLKVDEQHRFQQRDGSGSGTVSLTPAEDEWIQRFEATRQTVVADAREFAALRKASARGMIPEDSRARLEELAANREAARAAIDATLTELRTNLADEERSKAFAEMGMERSEITQSRLAKGSVLLHAVVLPEHLLLILTTPEAQVAEKVEVSAVEVRAAVHAFRQALTDPTRDPRVAGGQLYGWLIAPIEHHLTASKATALLTYLDGSLRYIPIAALYDGDHFVAEKWATVVYTAASEVGLGHPTTEDPWVAAFGTSKEADVREQHFSALSGVPGEIDAVVQEGSDDLGAMAGRSFLDEGFTAKQLSDSLTLETPWIHIASHFQFTPGGTEKDSYLLLGDGSTLSVAQLRTGDFPLTSVDLLALSACQTAMGDNAQARGSEVEGLAVVAQNKGAASVLATLWSVDDASTAAWMAAMYSGDKNVLSEAVRRVQLGFIGGGISAEALPGAVRSTALGAPQAKGDLPEGLEGWRHPYFWAPFVLYGTGA